jgi:hypothetical protein
MKNVEEELQIYRENLEYLVRERTMELEEMAVKLKDRNSELERFFDATVNREIRMEDMRVEIENLKKSGIDRDHNRVLPETEK